MTDPNIKPEPFDINHDQDGRLTLRDGGRLWASVDQGRTWAAVECPAVHGDDSTIYTIPNGTIDAFRLIDTTGSDERSGIMIEVPAEGWPEGWHPSPENPRVRFGPSVSPKMSWRMILPNTEPGRRAAWAMEGE